ADEQRAVAEQALQLADTYASFHRIALADTAMRDNNPLRAEILLDACPPDQRLWEWFYLKRQCNTALSTIATGPEGTWISTALSPDGRGAAGAGGDGAIQLWDLAPHRRIWTSPERLAPCRAVAYGPAGGHIASGHEDGSISLWEAESGRSVAVLRGHTVDKSVRGLAFRPDGQMLASASGDGTIRLWNVPSGPFPHLLPLHPSP